MFITSKPFFEKKVREILSLADIEVNGRRPWDIQVHNRRFFRRVLTQGALGLGESYMDGWWDCKQLDRFFQKVLTAHLEEKVRFAPSVLISKIRSRIVNLQTRAGSKKIAERHYDRSTGLYTSFLDPYNQYTCGYFKNTDDLNKAQEQKLHLICKKLMISSKDKVLDIGCGWGGFARFASERYGCEVTGITISKEQHESATEFCRGRNVKILLSDYRDLAEGTFSKAFDKVLICGMIEHVGYKNYRTLMRVVQHVLKDDGLFLLQTIGSTVSTTTMDMDPWMAKYIFPNSMLPSLRQLTSAVEGLFLLEDLHNFGAHYDQTLMAWSANFAQNWKSLESRYGNRFYRIWQYYLLSCAGQFRARDIQLWQIVFSKKGMPGGYVSVR